MDVYKTTFSGYQRLLNDPFSEPVSGVPNEFGERTRKIRVRVREMVVADANDVKFKCMPHAGVANDVDVVRIEGGHVLGTANSHLRTSSDYQNSDFGDTLRGRLVSARLRVTPTDATSNGTLYACSDPAREDISGLTNEEIERRFSKGNMAVGRASEETMVVQYRPTLDEEVEGWVTDATKGPYEFSREITATEYPCSHMITWNGNNAAGDVEVPSGVTNTAYAQGSTYNLYQAGTSTTLYDIGNQITKVTGSSTSEYVAKADIAFDGESGIPNFNNAVSSFPNDMYMLSGSWKLILGQRYHTGGTWYQKRFIPHLYANSPPEWYTPAYQFAPGIFTTSPTEQFHHYVFTFNNDDSLSPYYSTSGTTSAETPKDSTHAEWFYAGTSTNGTPAVKSGLFNAPYAGDIVVDYTGGYYRWKNQHWYVRTNGGWRGKAGAGSGTGLANLSCPDFTEYGPISMIICYGYNIHYVGGASIPAWRCRLNTFNLFRIPGWANHESRSITYPYTFSNVVTNTTTSAIEQGSAITVTTQGQAVTGVNQGSQVTYAAEAQTEARPQKFWVEYDAVYELSGDEVITDATPNPSRGGVPIVAYYDACSAVRKVGAGKREFDELDRGDKMS